MTEFEKPLLEEIEDYLREVRQPVRSMIPENYPGYPNLRPADIERLTPQTEVKTVSYQGRGSKRYDLATIIEEVGAGAGAGLIVSTVGLTLLGLGTKSFFAKTFIATATAIGGYLGLKNRDSSGS